MEVEALSKLTLAGAVWTGLARESVSREEILAWQLAP